MGDPQKHTKFNTITEASFRDIFVTHYDSVRSSILHQTNDYDLSDEICQRTFVKFWVKRDRIQVNQSVLNYLKRSAKNTLYDYYRSAEAHGRHSGEYAEQRNEVIIPDKFEQSNHRWKKINWAIEQLKPKTKEIFLLSRKEGLTMKEISHYKEMPRRTVEYQIRAAFISLRSLTITDKK